MFLKQTAIIILMDLSKLTEILKSQPKYRLDQVNQAIYKDLISDWDLVTGLPKELRLVLQEKCPLSIDAEIISSEDKNTVKALITLNDKRLIETVLMKHEDGRNTVCVSCMVGCPMACSFCATGEMKLTRKLTTTEIISQVLFWSRHLQKESKRVSGVVFMGMGEPLLYYETTMEAIKILNSPNLFNIGARHISISTCGILDGINKLANSGMPVNLAISLHAPNDTIRQKLMSIASNHTIKQLLETVDQYILKTNRKVMFEYLMIDEINDLEEHAFELVDLLKGKLCFVNLIQYNPTGAFTPSSQTRIKHFRDILIRNGINATIRFRFGQDIDGACGQLANKRTQPSKKR